MSNRGRAVLTASFLTAFTAFGIRLSYGVLLPEMLPSLGISKTEAGMIFSSYFIMYTVFSPVLGLLADRIDVRILLTIFSAILGAGTFLMGYSSSLIEASFFFGLAGIGAAACWSPVVALVQRWVSDKRRGITLAVIDAGGALGVMVCSAAIPLVVAAFDWRMGWKGLGTFAFLIAGVNFFFVRSYPGERSALRPPELSEHSREPVKVGYVRILGDIRFWLIGLSYLVMAFSVLIPNAFLSTYAVQELMLPYKVAARLITVLAATGIVGKLVLGSLSDTLGRIKLLILCGVLIGGGSLGMVFPQGFLTLSLFTGVFGVGHGAIYPLYAACASDYFPKKFAGSVVGLWTFLFGIGSTLSPVTAGWIADTTGTFSWSFILAVATAIVASLLLLPVGKASSSDDQH